MNMTAERARTLYYDMLRIRRVELRIEALYHEDNMKTPIHLCIGQEAISSGVCAHLRRTDPIFTTYRGHGQYLAKGGDLKRMIAELHCKETGCSRGRGGSMHLIDLAAGHYGSSAIVGGCIPIATGMALAARMKGSNAVTTVFLGDGAVEEGVFYESVNFAVLKRLPILYVLENNQWAVCSPLSSRRRGDVLFHHTPSGELYTAKADGNDVLAVYETTARALETVRASRGPAFIEFETYRLRGHNGAGSDVALGHRTQQEIDEWAARCPVDRLRRELLRSGLTTDAELRQMGQTIDAEIDAAFEFAARSPLPKPENLSQYVYCETSDAVDENAA